MTRITRRALAAAPAALVAGKALAAPKPASPASPWPDATEMAARIRKGEMTALEAVEQAVARAEKLQGQLNFIVNSDFDRALAKARAGTPAGPFGGVPFLVKDLNDYAGLPTRNGSQSGRNASPATSQPDYISAFDRATTAFRWIRDRYLIVTAVSGAVLIVMGTLMLTGQLTELNTKAQELLSELGLNFFSSV